MTPPALHEAFTVTSGSAVVATLHGYSAAIPQGGTWPGLQALDADLARHLRAAEVLLAPGAQVRPALPGELPGGVALIRAQALTRIGLLPARIRYARPFVTGATQEYAALLTGCTRPAYAKVMRSSVSLLTTPQNG